MSTGQQFTGGATASDSRPVFVYPIPETMRSEKFQHESVGLRLLNVDEELRSSQAGAFDVLKTQFEAAKIAIGEIDGKPANQANGDVDVFWENGGPKMRSLLLRAYRQLSAPSREEEKTFFGGMKVKVA